MTLFLLLLGCADEGASPSADLCRDPGDLTPPAFRAIYPGEDREGGPLLPSDHYLVEQGDRYQVVLPDGVLPSGLGDVEGFAPVAPVLVAFSADPDLATLSDETVRIFRYDQGALEPVAATWSYSDPEELLTIFPAALPEGAGIGVALLDGIRSEDGEPLGVAPVDRCLREGWSDDDYAVLARSHAEALAVLEAAGVDGVAYLDTFHTAAPNRRLRAATEALEAAQAAGDLGLDFDVVVDATDENGALSDEVKALLPADVSGGGTWPWLDTYAQGTLRFPDLGPAIDLDGDREAGEANAVTFTVLVPPLAAGEQLPVLLFLHGIACCRFSALALSEHFGSAGYVIAAIDAREHYVRGDPGATQCYSESDAIAFLNFGDTQAMAERFALSAMDEVAFELALRAELDGLLATLAEARGLAPAPTIGTVHLAGHSLGGILGALAASALPAEAVAGGARFADCAGGGSLVQMALPYLDQPLLEGAYEEADLQMLLEFGIGLALADPLSHGPRLAVDHLVQEAGQDDTMPLVTTETLAWASGLPLLEPAAWDVSYLDRAATPARNNLPDGRTGGLFQFDPAGHNMLPSSVSEDPELAWRVKEQIRLFLEEGVIYDAYGL